MAVKNLGPIPGQSLTVQPKSVPWERPPKHSNPDDAFGEYLDKFSDPDTRDSMFQLLESGVPLTTAVNMITRSGTSKGIHSVDTSVILRPVVHEYLRNMAEVAGVSYVEAPQDLVKDQRKVKSERSTIGMLLEKDFNKGSKT